jgi:hypothetical protein
MSSIILHKVKLAGNGKNCTMMKFTGKVEENIFQNEKSTKKVDTKYPHAAE